MAGNISPLTPDSFVRALPFTHRISLADILDIGDSWESLVAQIPLDYRELLSPNPAPFIARYTTKSFMTFRKQQSPTMSFLEDWETDNCQMRHLIQALHNANLITARNHILSLTAQQSSQQQQQHQQQQLQPQQRRQRQESNRGQFEERSLSCNDNELQEDVVSVTGGQACAALKSPPEYPIACEMLQGKGNSPSIASVTEKEKLCDEKCSSAQPMPEFGYELLRRITGNFDTREKHQGGYRIGAGGFGDVFFGQFLGDKVAVKRLKANDGESLKQFETEVKTLCEYKHENLVTLLGFCSDGEMPCLVYEYVINGSLEDRLACLHDSLPLTVTQRLDIATGTAKGIEYLHGKGVTHRDIKSANILLDEDFKPKVSDFATARTLPQAVDKKTRMMQTSVIIGTTFYLDPEAYDYEIHPGLDIYSFGVVLLELLTGKAVYDPNRENEDLKVHVREHCTPYIPDEDDSEDEEAADGARNDGTIFDLVDKRRGVVWEDSLVEGLYTLSKQCLEPRKNRKKIKNVLRKLESLTVINSQGNGVDLPEK